MDGCHPQGVPNGSGARRVKPGVRQSSLMKKTHCSRRSSFANQMGEALREVALRAELQYGREEIGGFTAHSFRHTFISRLAERSLPRETIMKLSGHTSRQGIEPYLHATPESIKRATELITGGDGFLTGGGVIGVAQVTRVVDSTAPKLLSKRELPPAQRVRRD